MFAEENERKISSTKESMHFQKQSSLVLDGVAEGNRYEEVDEKKIFFSCDLWQQRPAIKEDPVTKFFCCFFLPNRALARYSLPRRLRSYSSLQSIQKVHGPPPVVQRHYEPAVR